MHELHVASKITTISQRNTADFAFDKAAADPRAVALRRRVKGAWADVTTQQFADELTAVAKGLIAAGIGAGDRVAVMSKTRYEWTVADFALFTVGAVVVPIYETSSAEQVQWILSDSGATAIFVESADACRARRVRPRQGPGPGARVAVRGRGDPGTREERRRRRRRRRGQAARRGDPRRSRVDHLHVRHHRPARRAASSPTAASSCRCLELLDELDDFFNAQTSTLLFLPIAHVFGRVIEIGSIAAGCTLGHTADVKNLLDDLAGFKPTFVLAVPRVFEKVYNTAKQRAHADGKGRIFDRAEAVAIGYSKAHGRRLGTAAAQARSTRCSTGSSTSGCAPRSAATAWPRCPAARRSVPGSATSSAASA